ncbi:MAG: ISAs1 family transposase [Planctomycetia bacterium]
MAAADRRTHRDVDKGHGRREVRVLTTATTLNGYLRRNLDWPDVGQAFHLRRERTKGGRTTVEEVVGITSLPREQVDAAGLQRLVRRHWAIENGLHYVRDVTFGEDGCRVRKGQAPRVLAALRNAALAMLGRLKTPSAAAGQRRCVLRPRLPVQLIFQQD